MMEHEANHLALLLRAWARTLQPVGPCPFLAGLAEGLAGRIDAYLDQGAYRTHGNRQPVDLLVEARLLLLLRKVA